MLGFSYSKNMANFKAFHWDISSSINLLFLKSEKALKYGIINIQKTFKNLVLFVFMENFKKILNGKIK